MLGEEIQDREGVDWEGEGFCAQPPLQMPDVVVKATQAKSHAEVPLLANRFDKFCRVTKRAANT
jgi:hypothetical protein